MRRQKRKAEKKDRKFIIYMIIVAALALSVPHLLDYISGDPLMIGEEAHLHKRVSERITDLDFTKDELIVDGRILYYSPYHFMLALVGYMISPVFASIILPLMLGMGTIIIFYLLLERFPLERVERFAALSIFIVSPAFIYVFSASTEHSLSLFLIMLSILLYLKGGIYQKFAFASFILACMNSMFNGILLLLVLTIYVIKTKDNQKHIFFLLMLLLMLAFFVHPPWTSTYPPMVEGLTNGIVSDLGAKIGFSVFIVVLCLLGIIWTWPEKKRITALYILLAALLIISYFTGSEKIIYMSPIISIFAGAAVNRINKFRWRLDIMKNLTMLIIICGLLFSSISYIARLSGYGIDSGMHESLRTLEEDKGTVFSHYSNGFYIQDIAGLKTLTDSKMATIENIDEKLIDSHTLFFTRDLKEAKDIIGKYGIDYILIDEDMKNKIWEKEGQGLLFLLGNTETFKRLETPPGSYIYEVKT